jgi:hypothetical protein
LLETLLVVVNPNDRHYFCHQTNSLPVAAAKNMGIIGMKVFADGAMYGLEKRYASQPGQSVPTVGQPGKVSFEDFLHYSLSAEGMSTLITGIGLINTNNDPERDQLVANLAAVQTLPEMPASKRRHIEEQVAALHGTATNFFQRPSAGLQPPRGLALERKEPEGPVNISWHTAFAGPDPIVRYEVFRREEKIVSVPFRPQITEEPFSVTDNGAPRSHSGGLYYRVRAVDGAGRWADCMPGKPA